MTGRYKAYPEYKDSGVEWVGKIPSHWRLKKLKYLAPLISEKATEKTNPIALEHIQSWTGKLISTDSMFDGDGTKFKAGDILFGKLRPYLAKVYLTEEDGEAIGDFHVMRPINSSYGKFLKSLMLTTDYISTVDASTYGAKMPRASWDFTSNIQLPFCSEAEAEKIANFLDHETAKIDTLITKQEKLIELLKEKRQAVISHAVTKGLNPDAPMKDSGVEWLGEVPEHWAVAKLSYRYEVLLGKMLDEKKITGDFLGKYLRNTDVQWGTINTDNLPVMDFKPTEIERYSVKKGDLIVCEGGEIGRSAIWTSEVPCFYQKALHRLRPYDTKQDCSNFMYYVMFDAVHQERFSSGANKATIAHLPAETFRQYRFAYPPHTEQMAIAKYLEEIEHKFDSLQLAAKAQVELLTERKTALISAAVTGKIDVRHFVAEQGQPQGVQG